MSDNVWNGKTVYLTSFWGWTPDTWGNVGFTRPGRRDTVIKNTTDPFIVVAYVTKLAPNRDLDIRGKITGFYIVSHLIGHRNDFTAPSHFERNPEKWQYALKATRAFSFLPEYRLDIDEFDATIGPRARSVAASGEELGHDKIERLKKIPYVEVPVWGGIKFTSANMHVPEDHRHKVKAGPVNRSGYYVEGEPIDTEKELYALALHGNASHFLGKDARDFLILKIGLSLSPKTRLEMFRKTLPRGAFSWELYCSTRNDGHARYPSFESAEAGENAMKDYLGTLNPESWLGGEFYLATKPQIKMAWEIGRKAALAYTPNKPA